MKIKEFYSNNWLFVCIIILSVVILIAFLTMHTIFNSLSISPENILTLSYTLLIEVFLGILIALVVHNHTKKVEKREIQDVELAITGTYYNLWTLYMALISYDRSKEVRVDRISGLHIINIIHLIQSNLSKCGQKIDPESIETLQLNLVLLQNVIRALVDPRAKEEELWNKNEKQFKEAMNEIESITKAKFESIMGTNTKLNWTIN